MNSSGIKRGLAASAVAALAVVGLPLAAQANTVTDQMDAQYGDTTVTLYSQSTGKATVKNDGTNATIRLEAGATSDISTVRFQYWTGDNWSTIASVSRNDNGAFSTEWTPGAALLGTTVDIRAVGHSTIDGQDHDDDRSVAVQGAGGADNAVNLTDGDEIGVYQSPITSDHNVIASGTASAGSTDVSVLGATGAASATETVAGTSFKTVLDIEGSYDYDAPDEIVLGATNGTDDVEAYDLYKQALETVTATPAVLNPATPSTPTDVTVTVKDQKGKAIGGAQVSRLQGGGWTDLGFTDANGQVVAPQTVNDGTVTFLVNQTAVDNAYQPELGDIRTTLTLGAGFASSLAADSDDGNAFDRDEYAGGDITVQVKDQSGANFDVPDTQDLTWTWEITPFDGTEPTTTPADSDISDSAGLFTVDLPSGPSGTYELFASLSEGGTGHGIAKTKVATYKVGQASIKWDGPDPQIESIHTVATVTGKLLLEDGTALPGRKIDLDFDLGTEYDEDGNTFEADAQIISDTLVTTSASGAFSLKVEDLAETATRSELGGQVHAESAPAAGIGEWGAGDGASHHRVDFVTDQLPDGARITVEYDSSTAGPAGSFEDVSVHVEDAFGDDLAGVAVTLNLDHGYFTDGYEGAASGNYEYTPDALGSTIKVVTNASGDASAETSIGRDAGFDDDGKVTAKVTGSADGVSGSDTVIWDADNPLAASEVSLVRTPGQINPTPAGDGVRYDVFAKDQFGNLVSGVHVDIDCAVEIGEDDDCPADGETWDGESDRDNGGDLTVWADEAGTFTYTAVVDDPVTRKFDGSLDLDEIEVSDSVTEEFYASVPTTFTISAPTAKVPVGNAATVKVKVLDQKGNPIEGLEVEFVRSGDPSPWSRDTNTLGESAYVFNRTTAGTETVTAVVRGWDDEILRELQAKVVFGSTQVAINPVVSARSKGARDIVGINGPNIARGATVTLYRIVNGRAMRVASKRLNLSGNASFSVPDRNGNRKRTSYKVVVSATPATKRFASRVVSTR